MRAARFILATAFLGLAACAGLPRAARVSQAAAPLPAAVVVDPSYDWHGLVLVPFGTPFKSSPLRLHEVLVFHPADSRGGDASTGDGKDCYGSDETPPRFVGHSPETYLLCFAHDRLNRLEATVRVPAGEAEALFAHACAQWLKGSAVVAATLERCEGRDREVGWSARVDAGAGEFAVIAMTLVADADADAERAAPAAVRPRP